MKHRLCAIAAALLLCLPACSPAAGEADERVIAARDAFRSGDRAALARQVGHVDGHELESYVAYWELRQRLDEAPAAEVTQFLARNEGSLIADRLRGEWLKQLGLRHHWEDFDRELPLLLQSDQEIDCFALQRRLLRADAAALDEAHALWLSALELPGSCAPLMDALHDAERLSEDEVWARMRRLFETRRLSAAKQACAYLPAAQRPEPKLIDAIADNPQRHLDRQKPNFAATRLGREMAMYALARLARKDVEVAARKWESLKGRFSPAERGYVYAQLGWQAALDHLPQALSWYQAAGEAPLGDEQIQWKARAALRAGKWRALRQTVEAMPAHLAEKPDWIYWLGRALAAQGKAEEARALFERIAGQPNFYGNLADDELGRPIIAPSPAGAPTDEELARVAASPPVRRALALFRLDMRTDAIREWSWALRGEDDRFLLAAAEFAQRKEIFDRAISAADRTQFEHDYGLRYLMPFRDSVDANSKLLDLDPAWVYGLIRQESRFVAAARSSAGAQGLMQLMPSTAKWAARRVGLKDFHPSRIHDTALNVSLGTTYLKIVLDSLDNHPVLASAAYNAGPGRAQRWRDAKPLEGAIYAETIPLTETRDYVKKVMSNAVYYSALLEGRPQSLKARLGTVFPPGRNGVELPQDIEPPAAAE